MRRGPIRRFVYQHPTAVLRAVAIPLAVLLLWGAVALQGSPIGSVILGIASWASACLATMELSFGQPSDCVTQAWLREHQGQ
jgi:hypothetical protein